ncbi:conserved exported hypothetical protein [Syntrophobacter sp. SbD1]|nr:conserved exported hypothetical protein [Syntrophobacter sp. SbD1]
METLTSRRSFLHLTGSVASGIALSAISSTVLAAGKKEDKGKESEVNPVEDLMREHGVLRRVLLIYDEAAGRLLKGSNKLPPGVIEDSARIIRRFIEDYHEKLEEEEIFPRVRKAVKFDDLVKVLLVQHQAGRRLTDIILQLSQVEIPKAAKQEEGESEAMKQIYGGTPFFRWKGKDKKQDLVATMQQFIHMYRPHADREDTVLFPAFRSIVSPGEFDELGEKFEDREKELFGKEGFEKMVESVGEIEKKLGIYELSEFTPKA